MPASIKTILSLLVALVIGGYGAFSFNMGSPIIGMVTIVLAAMMILSIWIFPETGKVKRKKKRS